MKKMRNRKRWILWLPALTWMTVIFVLSHQPGQTLHSFLPFFQHVFPSIKSFDWGHLAAYFILAITLYIGLGSKRAHWRGRALAFFGSVFYGLTDEWHQHYVQNRASDMQDLMRDAAGAFVAMVIFSIPVVHRFYAKIIQALEQKLNA